MDFIAQLIARKSQNQILLETSFNVFDERNFSRMAQAYSSYLLLT